MHVLRLVQRRLLLAYAVFNRAGVLHGYPKRVQTERDARVCMCRFADPCMLCSYSGNICITTLMGSLCVFWLCPCLRNNRQKLEDCAHGHTGE